MKIPFVITNKLCTGCGICVAKNPVGLHMDWDEFGFLHPKMTSEYSYLEEDLVCPFSTSLRANNLNEDQLSKIFLKTSKFYNDKIGQFTETYIGFSEEYRLSSSSGGIATYISSQLLKRGLVDGIASVHAQNDKQNRFKFKIITNADDLINGSKTRYYPVTYAEILSEIKKFKGKIAISGVGCFIKGIRLLQYFEPIYKEKIAFTIGIICGGLKSSFFSDYLAQKAGADEYIAPEYRVKDLRSTAYDYSFECHDINSRINKSIKMRQVGDMWGTGYFKALACDFCDDVTTELADISLGDAWLPEYANDGKGQNVIVTRSKIANDIILEGIQKKEINAEKIPLGIFIKSQRGSFNHRQNALKYRVEKARKKGLSIPPKRHDKTSISFTQKMVQALRETTRRESLKNWRKYRSTTEFEIAMKPHKRRLNFITKLSHTKRFFDHIISR